MTPIPKYEADHLSAPYLILLRMGFTLRSRLALEPGSLLHHLFTLTPENGPLAPAESRGGLFSAALSVPFDYRKASPVYGDIPPCGVRTFLSNSTANRGNQSDHVSR